ncbi:DegT/DnrJ/EryC1/StrS family aminotransferase [Microlunatus soli]|uniref:dTDP-4-amino-4,6-dideoxygalactose transaminase n=1 Tax=Microlunatus soli TaxID=630515 RepID=A0A1H1UTX2_9ACTN|nr:DegT/DnrJ/EryC1/StrS family aminotransferase [Microlunatus soli]SDS75536.1 dTDP-4-amino-4,6-dideoxygalactose transaminase [Microlunatus soli]
MTNPAGSATDLHPIRTKPLPGVGDAAGRRLGAEEIAALTRVISSGQLNSTVGNETRTFEAAFADYYDIPYAVTATSGTAAIHLAVAAVDPEPGDEIITTGLSDAGTVLPILAQNAIPVFADVDPRTGNLDPDAVQAKITDRTRAIIAVHLFGIPAPVAELRAIADRHGIVLIEDCAQAYLTRTAEGALAGTVGQLGCFSLQQSKHITAGDGGIVISADEALARRARLFADKGWPRDTGERTHLFLGLNYRMTELQAAVAGAQLGKLAGVVADRRRQAIRLTETVDALPGLSAAPVDGNSYWQFPIYLDPEQAGGDAAEYAAVLRQLGIGTNPGYLDRPLYRTPALADAITYGSSGYPLTAVDHRPDYSVGSCPQTEELINHRLLVVMWNENYTDADVDDLALALRTASDLLAR